MKVPVKTCQEVLPDWKPENETIAFFYTSFFGGAPHEENLAPRYCVNGMEGTCRFTYKKECKSEAAGYIFHARDVDFDNLPPKQHFPRWTFFTLEPPLYDEWVVDEEKLDIFDYSMTYLFNSTFPFPYNGDTILHWMRKPMEPLDSPKRSKKAQILWIGSNCESFNLREEYIAELMKYVDIDSYGKCLNNKPYPEGKEPDEILKEYRYYLSFENSNCDDYVTEKLYRCYKNGVVPIVWGPKDFSKFMASENAVIQVDNFQSPKELAEYLKEEIEDKTNQLYMRHFDWKDEKKMSKKFFDLWSKQYWFKGLCDYCKQIKQDKKDFDNGKILPRLHIKADHSCKPSLKKPKEDKES